MRLRSVLFLSIGLGAAGCAEREAVVAPSTPVLATPGDSTADVGPEAVALTAAETAWVAGDWGTAMSITDSLDASWIIRPEISADLIRRLVRLLQVRASDDRAVHQLLYHPAALDEEWRGILRGVVGGLSLAELDRQSRRVTSDARALGTVRAELVRAAALAGDPGRAATLAADLEDADLDGADRDKVEDVLSGAIPVARSAIRLGVIVPRTGGFASVGEEILQGVGLAAARYERDAGLPVELVVIDEALESDSTGFGVPRLEARDVAGIIGPIRSAALRSAAAARTLAGTLIISPTAAEDSTLGPHAYSIWARERRDRAVAEALGTWLTSSLEPARVVALHPANESGIRRSDAFRGIVEAAGFGWAGSRAYEPDSTTFELEIRELTELDPDVVLVIADGPRQVLQIAPQLHFYGLRGRIALVSEDWTHPTVLRRLDATFSDYRVSATYFERTENPEWIGFAADWDEAYRRDVPDNAFAALGYDAALLLLRTIPDPGLVRAGAVARAMTRIGDLHVATGRFSYDPESRRVVRSTRVRMLLDSRLVEPDASAIVDWSLEARAQEEERLRLEAEEELLRRGGSP
ncbi:MAG: ABC transporter substrate-binding protein [Gemmatimonadota bacterium]